MWPRKLKSSRPALGRATYVCLLVTLVVPLCVTRFCGAVFGLDYVCSTLNLGLVVVKWTISTQPLKVWQRVTDRTFMYWGEWSIVESHSYLSGSTTCYSWRHSSCNCIEPSDYVQSSEGITMWFSRKAIHVVRVWKNLSNCGTSRH